MRGRLKSVSAKRLASKGFSGESPRLFRHKTQALQKRARRLRSADKSIAAASPEMLRAAALEASTVIAAVNGAIAEDAAGRSHGAQVEADAAPSGKVAQPSAAPEDATGPDDVILAQTVQPLHAAERETIAAAVDAIPPAWEQPSPEATAPENIPVVADEAPAQSAPISAPPAETGDPIRQEIAEPSYSAQLEAIDAEAPPTTASEDFGAPPGAILPEPPRPRRSAENRPATSGEPTSPTAANTAPPDDALPTAPAQPWHDTESEGVTIASGEPSPPSANESTPPADAIAATSSTRETAQPPRSAEKSETIVATSGEPASFAATNTVATHDALPTEPAQTWHDTENEGVTIASDEATSPSAHERAPPAAISGTMHWETAQPPRDLETDDIAANPGEAAPLPASNPIPAGVEQDGPGDTILAGPMRPSDETVAESIAAMFGETASPSASDPPPAARRVGATRDILRPERVQPSHKAESESVAAISGAASPFFITDPAPATGDSVPHETAQPHGVAFESIPADPSDAASLRVTQPEDAAGPADAIPPEPSFPSEAESTAVVQPAASPATPEPGDIPSPGDAIPPQIPASHDADAESIATGPGEPAQHLESQPTTGPEDIDGPANAADPETPPSYRVDVENVAANVGEQAPSAQFAAEPEDIPAPGDAVVPETPPSYRADAENVAANIGEQAPNPESQFAAATESIAAPGNAAGPETPPSYRADAENVAANIGEQPPNPESQFAAATESIAALGNAAGPEKPPSYGADAANVAANADEQAPNPESQFAAEPEDIPAPADAAGPETPASYGADAENVAAGVGEQIPASQFAALPDDIVLPGDVIIAETAPPPYAPDAENAAPQGGGTAPHAVSELTAALENDAGPDPEPARPWHGADGDGAERESAVALHETASPLAAWAPVAGASLAAAPMAVPADAIPAPLANHSQGGMADAWRLTGIVLLLFLALPYFLTPFYRFIDPPVSAVMTWQFLGGTMPHRRWVDLEDISPALPRAVVIAEDSAFCRHWGVDWRAVGTVLDNVENGDGPHRGASTIPMQTAKNLFLWNGFGFVRKMLEVPLAYYMSVMWPKRRVLEVYLNIAEWGPGIFGAEAAARHHFGKSAAQLTSREAALLAAALPNPILRKAGRPSAKTARIAAHIQARVGREGQDAACVLSR
jgi:monofunctional glycosyltransferase